MVESENEVNESRVEIGVETKQKKIKSMIIYLMLICFCIGMIVGVVICEYLGIGICG